ncbi:MAG: acyl-CoA dehydrogenase family protein [Bacteroidota bacterium]
MDFRPSPRSEDYLRRLKEFMQAHVYPFEKEHLAYHQSHNPGGNWKEWTEHPRIAELKEKARAAGLWNLFLPDSKLGEGLSVLEYAPLAEEMGRVFNAAEIFNCNAPDTGNMEVLYHFGTEAQKAQWLRPLLDGKIKSVFSMTEPAVASSDATNIQTSIVAEGDDIRINGRKWWSTGLGHPEAKLAIVLGKSEVSEEKHRQHSMVLVPLDSPGVEIVRMQNTFGTYDPPGGHGEVIFRDVRVPKENLILELGAGFAIAQGRLGPGRIHHCMRCIGAAERALELAIIRSGTRRAFGKQLARLGGNSERFAEARIAIDQARLLTHYAAWKIDQVGAKASMTEISAIKVVAPKVLQEVTDMAMQIHGGAGLSDDFPLAGFFIAARALRLADGPDEVHLRMISRLEFKKYLTR